MTDAMQKQDNELPAVVRDYDTLEKVVRGFAGSTGQMLPDVVNKDAFFRCILAYWNKPNNPFAGATTASIINALQNAASIGIVPDGALGMAYLVKYGSDCTLVPGYKGYIQLAYSTSKVLSIDSYVVHEGEHFVETAGLSPNLEHVPDPKCKQAPVVAAYAVAHLAGGGHVFEVMYADELAKIRKMSRAKPAWKDWEDQMYRKAPIRRLHKRLPMSREMREMARFDAIADEAMKRAEVVGMTSEPVKIGAGVVGDDTVMPPRSNEVPPDVD